MNKVALERAERQRARYTINTVVARIKLAAQTLERKQTCAPHRFILMGKAVLESLEQSAGVLPFTDAEAMRGNLIVYCRIYCGCPVVSDDAFDNPEIFQTISDIMLLDCSLTSLNHSSALYTTVCSGHNIIEVVFYPKETPIGPAGTVRSAHYCFMNSNFLNQNWTSHVDWDKFGLTSPCKDFVDYQSTNKYVIDDPINKVSNCRSCGTMYMPYFGLDPQNLLAIYEKHHGVIDCG